MDRLAESTVSNVVGGGDPRAPFRGQGLIIVGAGGGLIKPMQTRWEQYLTKAESEAPKIKQHAASAPSPKEIAAQAAAKAKRATAQPDGGSTRVAGR